MTFVGCLVEGIGELGAFEVLENQHAVPGRVVDPPNALDLHCIPAAVTLVRRRHLLQANRPPGLLDFQQFPQIDVPRAADGPLHVDVVARDEARHDEPRHPDRQVQGAEAMLAIAGQR